MSLLLLFQSGGGTPPPVVIDADTHDGRPRFQDDAEIGRRARERERERADDKARLRRSVEAAFRRQAGLDDETEPAAVPVPVSRPASKREIRAIALAVRPEIRMDGAEGSLRDIEALLAELQAAMVAERLAQAATRKRREEELLILLMAAV